MTNKTILMTSIIAMTFLVGFSAQEAFAGITLSCSSVTSGDWSNANTWECNFSPTVPTSNTTVKINPTHTVTVDADAVLIDIVTIDPEATLIINQGVTLNAVALLNESEDTIENNGSIDVVIFDSAGTTNNNCGASLKISDLGFNFSTFNNLGTFELGTVALFFNYGTFNNALPTNLIGVDEGVNFFANSIVTIADTCTPSDTTPPVIAAHLDVTAEATGPTGATVSYTSPSTSDDVDGTGTATCSPLSGTLFALGTTEVTCDATDTAGNPAISTNFNVIVQDTTPPVIALLGGDLTLEAGIDTYPEQGATAVDIVDGTVVVVISGDTVDPNTPGIYIVTYDATDEAGNPATQVTRTVNVVDTTPPVITLTGANPITLLAGVDTYTEQGATAVDIVDGTFAATVGGHTVDAGIPGEYIVTYDATDEAGNPATQVTRTITVLSSSDATDNLITGIEDLGLANNTEKSLLGPLKKVIKTLDDGNPDNDMAACDKLDEFIANAESKIASGKIVGDDVQTVNDLIADAEAIQTSIGC